MMWIVKIYENGKWRQYGSPSSDFHRLWKICEKFSENGTKARVERYGAESNT